MIFLKKYISSFFYKIKKYIKLILFVNSKYIVRLECDSIVKNPSFHIDIYIQFHLITQIISRLKLNY